MDAHDRHKVVQDLFDAAVSLQPSERLAFLSAACHGDAQLLGEVLALISSDSRAEDFSALPFDALLETLGGVQEHAVFTGRTFGHYSILELLGKGGMGEVYRALDTRLARDVAIKFVPIELASDESRLRRLEREARMLASINHPNIATIYGLEFFGENRLLVMEMVPGESLDQIIDRGPIPIRQALLIFRQIAEALAAAHDRGVIHRDLKPANVKVSPEAKVKLLDFGLAKALESKSSAETVGPDSATSITDSGLILGTPGYMSPEQALGQRLDHRTDIWAFGAMTYEAITGQRAFGGASIAEVFANILHKDPVWTKLPEDTPPSLAALLRRCLQKDANSRPPNTSDLLAVIDQTIANTSTATVSGFSQTDLKIHSPSTDNRRYAELAPEVLRPDAPTSTATSKLNLFANAFRWRGRSYRSIALLLALALILAVVIIFLQRARRAPVPQLTNPIQVTRATGVEDYPTWSPDPETLAYESNQSGNWDIWVIQVGGGTGVDRTADYKGTDRYPSWSPDGRQIAFWSDRDGSGYYLMPSLGGTPQLLASTPGRVDNYESPAAWSPDSSRIALAIYKVVQSRVEAFAKIISLATRDTAEFPLPGSEESRLDLSWSPDGNYLAYVDSASQLGEVSRLKLLRLSDGTATELSDGRSNVRSPCWASDSRHLFFTSNRAGATDLWRQQINSNGQAIGDPERVTTGLEVPNGSFSDNAGRFAYSKGRWVSNIWRVPILSDRVATWADAQQITFDQAFTEFVDVSPDGKTLAFSSDRTGNQDLWTIPVDGGQPTQVTSDPAPDWDPNWSPDGKLLAYYSFRTGDREIWVVSATGGPATQLTHSRGLDAGARWSPSGEQLAFRSERTGDSELWIMSADGTNERQLTHNPAGDYGGTFSPDGKWIAFSSNRSGGVQIWRISPEGGNPELMSQGPGNSPRWAPDGDLIIFPGVEERRGNLWVLSIKDHSERPLTDLTGKRGTIGSTFPATDGRFIYFTWRDDVGDIWVMDVNKR
jgi:Tol biopolymer transport system component